MDIVDETRRSGMMSKVKRKNTSYELEIRKRLYAKGFRYRIDVKELPGRPDIVFKKQKVVIFINGCFWHLHRCHLSRIPTTRYRWWENKLEANKARDKINIENLLSAGWRVLVIWECAFRHRGGTKARELSKAAELAIQFLLSNNTFDEVSWDSELNAQRFLRMHQGVS